MEAQMRLFFFFIVMISAATEDINLTATEGGNITLPDPVLENGYIIFKGKLVAMVDNGSLKMQDLTYTNRLHWDKNTGLFTITGLKMSDSGTYTIGPNEENIFPTPYILTVYEHVSSPAVNTVNVSTESCILLCSVDKAETTLLWYKDEEILNQSSSALSLPLTVHKQDFRSSYRCVAANPAEHKTLHVNIKTSCWNITDNTDNTDETERHYLVPLIICIMSVVVLVSLVIIAKKKCHKKSERITSQAQESEPENPEIHYTEVQIRDNSCGQGGSSPDSSGTVDRSNLLTVYDKLEAHRILPQTDTTGNGSDQHYSNC